MNIDDRIEKLTERHEAIAQSLELLTSDVHELQETVNGLQGAVRELQVAVSNTNHILLQNSERMDAKILALLTLAGLHQKRLDGLEGIVG